MKRDAFLKLTDLSVDNHKNLKRRGLLPYAEEIYGEPQGWSEYSLEQALSTVLALNLAKVGLDQQTASHVVARHDGAILQAVKPALESSAKRGPEIWLAVVRFAHDTGPMGIMERHTAVVAPFSELHSTPTTIDKTATTLAEIERVSPGIVLTNLSRAIRTIQNRAERHGIEADFTSIRVPQWVEAEVQR